MKFPFFFCLFCFIYRVTVVNLVNIPILVTSLPGSKKGRKGKTKSGSHRKSKFGVVNRI